MSTCNQCGRPISFFTDDRGIVHPVGCSCRSERGIDEGLLDAGECCFPTKCPVCHARVWFVRHNGGSVWFDNTGVPWPKHSCMDGAGGYTYWAQVLALDDQSRVPIVDCRCLVACVVPVRSAPTLFGICAYCEDMRIRVVIVDRSSALGREGWETRLASRPASVGPLPIVEAAGLRDVVLSQRQRDLLGNLERCTSWADGGRFIREHLQHLLRDKHENDPVWICKRYGPQIIVIREFLARRNALLKCPFCSERREAHGLQRHLEKQHGEVVMFQTHRDGPLRERGSRRLDRP